MKTIKARKQRFRTFNAPAHLRGRYMSSLVDGALREKNPNLPRSVPIRKGDEVRVLRGDFKGKTGKVALVDRRDLRVEIEEITQEKADKKPGRRPVHASNLVIIRFDERDERRRKRLARKREARR